MGLSPNIDICLTINKWIGIVIAMLLYMQSSSILTLYDVPNIWDIPLLLREHMEKALKHVYHVSTNKTKGKEWELLLAILPNNNGSLYGNLKRICETDLGLISQ
ncbi:hypothetical protein JHK82_012517 [Glycine max]|nr:hypothetical protein JHK87_012433 [Glycine soja]KAG5040396.1 hypothetical protein JHK85_012872 [Glycine max]KAG5057540.1 hypothetical protein JHK86_012536 [Glycine max]KAG5154548.1 hypothetical protein JHK82_012517 [Glycine max]